MQFDLAKTFDDQKKFIYKKLLPALKLAMNSSLNAYGTVIVKLLSNYIRTNAKYGN